MSSVEHPCAKVERALCQNWLGTPFSSIQPERCLMIHYCSVRRKRWSMIRPESKKNTLKGKTYETSDSTMTVAAKVGATEATMPSVKK